MATLGKNPRERTFVFLFESLSLVPGRLFSRRLGAAWPRGGAAKFVDLQEASDVVGKVCQVDAGADAPLSDVFKAGAAHAVFHESKHMLAQAADFRFEAVEHFARFRQGVAARDFFKQEVFYAQCVEQGVGLFAFVSAVGGTGSAARDFLTNPGHGWLSCTAASVSI
jgi:hypothetical protein